MKACVIQPEYSVDYSRSDELFSWLLNVLDSLDDSLDLVVLPEYTDVPALAPNKQAFYASSNKYRDKIIDKAKKTAKRINAVVFFNALSKEDTGYRNTTYAVNRKGEIVGKYFKQHLTQNEIVNNGLDAGYTFDFEPVTVIEIDGVRYGFLTCYDFYFYETFSRLALENLDVIIGCSHQRTDTHEALSIINKFCAYNTGAYVVRASVSMGENSLVGGGSSIVSPSGEVLLDLKSKIGVGYAEFNPKEKYLKPAGFNNPLTKHYEYIEKGRRAVKNREGQNICRPDEFMSYPRICAHRGFNSVAPENSLPAFAAAIALGAQEIEFDLWKTIDGQIVSSHDPFLERVSNGEGIVNQKSYEYLKGLDFGSHFSPKFKDLRICTFEEILKQFAKKVIMNIHLKEISCDVEYLDKVVALIKKYDCQDFVYFMTGHEPTLELLMNRYPSFTRCAGAGDEPWGIVDRAIKFKCKKVQLFKPFFNEEMIKKAKENGIKCNVFFADELDEAKNYIKMGIDTILTNDYFLISHILK